MFIEFGRDGRCCVMVAKLVAWLYYVLRLRLVDYQTGVRRGFPCGY